MKTQLVYGSLGFIVITGILAIAYVEKFRGLKKYIIRKLTGTHEIERESQKQNLVGFYNSVKKSKQLRNSLKYFKKEIEQDTEIRPSLIEDVFIRKNISLTRAKYNDFLKMFTLLFNSFKSRQYIEEIRKTIFDATLPVHEDKLRKFWNILTNNKALPNLITRDWIDLGFQGENPSTDFRGAGYLGLENLVYFAEAHKDDCLAAYLDSINQKHSYFFASAGLYITLEIWRYMNEDLFDEIFSKAKSREHALALFNEIYSVVFLDFAAHWVKQPDATMMNFNIIIQQYFLELKEKRLSIIKSIVSQGIAAKL